MFDCIKADLQRHFCCDGRDSDSLKWKFFIVVFAYGFQASTVYRWGRFIDERLKDGFLYPLSPIANTLYFVGKFLTWKMYGIAIDRKAVIAEGLYIGHFGGISIGNCRIGRNCNVHQLVRIGDGCTLGDNVWIGAHAVVEEGVMIADQATVMVGARVTQPVGSRCLASGNPARIIHKNYDNLGLLRLRVFL